MITYARFQAQGYPIGSGSVESANKVVVESRLKGAGMHWARPHVNPLVALRTLACSDRWAEAWPQIAQQVRQQAWQRRLRRLEARSQPQLPVVQNTPLTDGPVTSTMSPPRVALPMQPMAPPCPCRPWLTPPKRRTDRRPTTPGAACISAEPNPLAPARLPPQNFDGDPGLTRPSWAHTLVGADTPLR